MKKTLFKKILVFSALSISLVSCGGGNVSLPSEPTYTQDIYALYVANGGTMSYEDWLKTIKGDKGDKGDAGTSIVSILKTNTSGNVDTYTIVYSNSTTSSFTITNGLDGSQGIQGVPGKDGHTPTITISSDGYWVIDGEKTTSVAKGPQGNHGENGVSIVSIIKTSTDGNVDTYTISYSNGATSAFTVTNGQDGAQGIQGLKGDDGHTPVVTISTDGYWVIDGVATTQKAQGPKGDKGDNGNDGTSLLTGDTNPSDSLGKNGDSYINTLSWDYFVKENGSWIKKGNIKNSGESENEQELDFYLQDDGTYGVGMGKATYLSSITIPSTYKGKPVTSIVDNGFMWCKKVKSIFIPNSVTTIGFGAFMDCYSITSITLPNSLTSIGERAFESCSSLSSITIPENVTSIGYGTFSGCSSLTSITIPDSVTSIGDSAFSGCSSLTSITIPHSVTSIGSNAFYNCTSLTIYCDVAIKPLNWVRNWNSSDRPVVWGNQDEQEIFNNLIYYVNKDGDENKSATIIGVDDRTITEIVVPEFINGVPVKGIAQSAFSGCSSLVSISLPFIGESRTDNQYLGYIFGATDYTSSLWKVPQSLKEVIVLDGCESISEFAFYGCRFLTSISIPDSVTSIGSSAFSGCSSLETIIIPFVGESRIDNQYLGYIFGTEEYDNSYSIYQTLSKSYHYIPSSLRNVTITGGYIPKNAFSECVSFTSVCLGNNVTTIESNAFKGCTSLTSVTIPDSVTYIGSSAFLNCSSLTSIIIPDSVALIQGSTFKGCASLASVTIPDSVTSIGDSAFYNCTSLASITIPDSVTSIGGSAFYNCTSLTSIIIPDSVTSIESYTFFSCTSLTSVTIPESVTSIGYYAFRNCTSLTSIIIPDSVTSIGDRAISGCTSLTSIIIPESVTSIDEYAFGGCFSLTIYCEASSKPSGWHDLWNYSGRPVVWGYKN